jgi:hypothetical protein
MDAFDVTVGIGMLTFVAVMAYLMIADPFSAKSKGKRRAQRLNAQVPLFATSRWHYTAHGTPVLQLDVSEDDKTKDWRDMLVLDQYSSPVGSRTPMEVFEERADLVRRAVVRTNSLRNLPPFPLPEGKWEVRHNIGDTHAIVNGHRVPAGAAGDYRDTVAAMIVASPLLEEEHSRVDRTVEQREKLGNVLIQGTP